MGHPLLEPWRPGRDGPWDRSAAWHLLARAGFGPAPGEVERALDLGLEKALAELFQPRGHDRALLEGVEHVLPAGDIGALQAWWMALILGGGDPLRERATLMWHNHFATSNDKVADVRLMHRQNALLRAKGLGDFRELLHSVARDPAMLVWLDGNENRKGHANENFAREVMELFALGIGNYGERDVLEAARGFTGWGTEGRSFASRAHAHDGGAKTIFGRSGSFDGGEVIDLVLAHHACPVHVARRLAREFVSIDAGDEVLRAIGQDLARDGWHVGRAVERILRSKLFFSESARGARIAGPVELVARSARALSARVPPAEAARAAGRMGQSLLCPPSVKGWDGGRAWIHAGTWLARHNLLCELVLRQDAGVDLAALAGRPKTPEQAARGLASALLPSELAPESLRLLVEQAVARAGDMDRALADVAALVLTSPEYHLC